MPPTARIYLRNSSDRQAKAATIRAQRPGCEAIAARLGNQHAPRASEVHRLLERVPDALLVPIAALGGPAAASAVRCSATPNSAPTSPSAAWS